MTKSSKTKNLNKLIDYIQKEIGKQNAFLHEPHIFGNEYKYLENCIKENSLSSFGKYIIKFENIISKFTKSKYCVSCINGTSALHLSLLTANVSKSDEIIIPSFNYVAAANAVKYIGGSIIFVDINTENLTIDIKKLKDYLKKNTYRHGKHTINKKEQTKRLKL